MRQQFKQQPKRKSVSAFFEYFMKQSGQDFLLRENSANLKRRATMFFRDLAHGTFDIDKHGQYLSDDRLIGCMVDEARVKMMYYWVHCTALNNMLEINPGFNSPDVQDVSRKDNDSFTAYSIIYNNLVDLLLTKNLSMLGVIANQIKPFKYNL